MLPRSMQNGIWGAHESTSTFPPFPASILQFSEVELVAVACCPILNLFLLCFSVLILELFSAGRMSPLSYPPFKSYYLSPRLNDIPHHEPLHPQNSCSSHPPLNSQRLLLGCYLCPGPISASSWPRRKWAVSVPISQAAFLLSGGMVTCPSDFPLWSHLSRSQNRWF